MSKEHSYAYEAGYRDGSINYELEHCPACKNVADLQEALDENAKLRELVRDMMRFFEDGDYCTACEKVAECDAREEYDDSCLMRGVFHARMRELGVDG